MASWMNANALTVIDVRRREVLNTVLLDDIVGGSGQSVGRRLHGGRPLDLRLPRGNATS